jgi:acetyl-CoA acetyltransferase
MQRTQRSQTPVCPFAMSMAVRGNALLLDAVGDTCRSARHTAKVTDSTNIGGASVVAHVGHAVRAIVSGQCEVAVIAYASTQRTDAGKLVTGADILPYERPYGALFPISGYAMVTQRHMHEYGTTREQLAKVTVAASQWASLNPDALKPEPSRYPTCLAPRSSAIRCASSISASSPTAAARSC